ncbi:hypothetical protein ppKF707_2987 [Metapseudomonas furukawaii]|jgi:hypothetical protein|nr:hypothetical protein ppKF707_2987 [Pseudomonas furukawaii]
MRGAQRLAEFSERSALDEKLQCRSLRWLQAPVLADEFMTPNKTG